MHAFKIGDYVRVVSANCAPEYVGEECTIVGTTTIDGMFCYLTDLPRSRSGLPWAGPSECFKRIYDGNKPAAWADCAWMPKAISA